MMSLLANRMRLARGDDRGFSLVELLVSMVVFSALSGAILTFVLSANTAATTTKQTNDINEEARLALNRMTRELRQAKEIRSVDIATNGAQGMTFWVDFNGDGTDSTTAGDPEVLEYSYASAQIRLTADIGGGPVTKPILAGNVTYFNLQYLSSKYQYDCDGDGQTTWQELDNGTCVPLSAGVGNGDLNLNGPELTNIDSVVITIKVLSGKRQQTYRSRVDLRNRA